MSKSTKEFLMWEKKFDDCHVQCTWKSGIYSVLVKVGKITKQGTFDQFEEPAFGTMSPKDREASAALARKITEELKSPKQEG